MKGQQTLLVSKLCRIDQSRIDMDGPEGRIAAEDLVASSAFGQAVENHRNGNTGTRGTQLAAANRGISDQMFAPIDHGIILSICGLGDRFLARGSHPVAMVMATLKEPSRYRKQLPRHGHGGRIAGASLTRRLVIASVRTSVGTMGFG